MQPLNHRPGPAPSLPVEAFHFHQYNSSPGLLWTLWPLGFAGSSLSARATMNSPNARLSPGCGMVLRHIHPPSPAPSGIRLVSTHRHHPKSPCLSLCHTQHEESVTSSSLSSGAPQTHHRPAQCQNDQRQRRCRCRAGHTPIATCESTGLRGNL